MKDFFESGTLVDIEKFNDKGKKHDQQSQNIELIDCQPVDYKKSLD